MLLFVEIRKEDDPLAESRVNVPVEFDRAVWVVEEGGKIIAYQLIDTDGKTVQTHVSPPYDTENMLSRMTNISGVS